MHCARRIVNPRRSIDSLPRLQPYLKLTPLSEQLELSNIHERNTANLHARTVTTIHEGFSELRKSLFSSIMATAVKGAVAYKKKDGTLALSATQTEVTWTPTVSGTAPPLTIPIASITSKLASSIHSPLLQLPQKWTLKKLQTD